MTSKKGELRICERGHRYYKSSDCPTCPVCEEEKRPTEGFLSHISAPARRALEGQGITTLEELSQYSEKEVWSLTCFFIKREYRKQGLTRRLITEAIDYATSNGAKYVEAYPVEPDSPSYRFMGFRHVFEDMDFKFLHKAGKRRHVMIYPGKD